MTKDKNRYVDPASGKITIIHKEERFPYSTEILMGNGFSIILLNMMFGLLPTSLFGSRLKSYRCSVAKVYGFTFGICLIGISFVFVPVSFKTEFLKSSGNRTDIVVLIIIKFTHVCGFLFLLIRGYWISKNIPSIWSQLAKLVQISVVDLHGKKYRCLKKIRR